METVVRIRARIELLPVRRSPGHEYYGTGIRPNHFFPGLEGSTIGRIDFEGRDKLKFGEACEAEVTLLWLSEWPSLAVGTQWRLQEGAKHVGNGYVLEVFA